MSEQLDQDAPPAHGRLIDGAGKGAGKGHGVGGLLHGPHATEIIVITSVVGVGLAFLTFRKSSSSTTAAAAATTSPTGVTAGDVAGFDQASVQGMTDNLQTFQQANANAFDQLTAALKTQQDANTAAQTGLQTAIANQGAVLGNLSQTISALPQAIASKIPAPVVSAPAPAAPAPAPAAPAAPHSGQWYTIRPGDTLSAIAAPLPANITPNTIARLNGIADPNRIRAGQTIRLW